MLSRQKNLLFAVIVGEGFSPDTLDVSDVEVASIDNPVVGVRVRQATAQFQFQQAVTDFDRFRFRYRRYAPDFPWAEVDVLIRGMPGERGSEPPVWYADRDHWIPQLDWIPLEAVLPSFEKWLKEVARKVMLDLVTPDLWSDGGTTVPTQLLYVPSEPHRLFSDAERAEIRRVTADFRQCVLTEYRPTAAQITAIDDDLRYLMSAVGRLNRFDWKALALSSVVGILTTLCLDAAMGRRLWEMFARAMRAVFRYAP